ncbi:tyrosine phosphatase family protein [Tepidamorphus sp. 3E244]|uniref:tyrosine phosphatase family protein n=1 Tax=Tepidamorphus sp. 3E244 TaxID=3385498 RepID=UPI0038FCBFF8
MNKTPPAIHVCSLSRLHETVSNSGASHIVTLINAGTPVERPAHIAEDRHLFLGLNDIVSPLDGMTLPGAEHVERLIDFAQGWDRSAPMVVHCWAGISRSTAGGFIAACALNPHRDPDEIAKTLRKAAPSATPNALLVDLADQILERGGAMSEAIRSIGRGQSAFEGEPFVLELHDAPDEESNT